MLLCGNMNENLLQNHSQNLLENITDSILENADKIQVEKGDIPLTEHGSRSTMKRRYAMAASVYGEDLSSFINAAFEILPEKNKYRLGFPTRLFSHLFTYRFTQDCPPSDFYQLNEARVTDPRYAGRKHSDNVTFVTHAMRNLYPGLESSQVNCPHPVNPNAKKKVNPYAQVRCFDRLVMREDSEFLNKEILTIYNNQNHFLNPLLQSWLMKKRLLQLAGQEPALTPEQPPTGATEQIV